MRLLALLLSWLALGACTNMVRSAAPWFGPTEAAGAPALRDGVWAALDPDCRFDADRPLEEWPGCARGRVVRGGEELALNSIKVADARGRLKQVDYDWSSEAFVLGAGMPRIHQRACGEPRGAAEGAGEPPGNAAERSGVDEAVSRLVYCYAGLRADTLDAEGRIVAFTIWPIWCGPFPQRTDGQGGSNVTDTPFPGLTLVGEHCVADDVDALRAAAMASENLDARGERGNPFGPARFRWIRDGWR